MSETSDPFGPIHGRRGFREHIDRGTFPAHGLEPDEAYELLHTGLMLDGRETLNLASFVTTWMEPQAEKLIHDTLRKNHIDHEEYPAASLIEEACVHMLGDLFNAPDSDGGRRGRRRSGRPRRSCSACSPTSARGGTVGRRRGCRRTARTWSSAPRPTWCGTSSPTTSTSRCARSR